MSPDVKSGPSRRNLPSLVRYAKASATKATIPIARPTRNALRRVPGSRGTTANARIMARKASSPHEPRYQGLWLSALTISTPITSRARVRVSTLTSSRAFVHPPSAARCKDNGIDIPAMNRNEGKTISGRVMASASTPTCFSQDGARDTPATSFTKIIRKITRPRSASTDATRSRSPVAAESFDTGISSDTTATFVIDNHFEFTEKNASRHRDAPAHRSRADRNPRRPCDCRLSPGCHFCRPGGAQARCPDQERHIGERCC